MRTIFFFLCLDATINYFQWKVIANVVDTLFYSRIIDLANLIAVH
jgi:hypothetical protein